MITIVHLSLRLKCTKKKVLGRWYIAVCCLNYFFDLHTMMMMDRVATAILIKQAIWNAKLIETQILHVLGVCTN